MARRDGTDRRHAARATSAIEGDHLKPGQTSRRVQELFVSMPQRAEHGIDRDSLRHRRIGGGSARPFERVHRVQQVLMMRPRTRRRCCRAHEIRRARQKAAGGRDHRMIRTTLSRTRRFENEQTCKLGHRLPQILERRPRAEDVRDRAVVADRFRFVMNGHRRCGTRDSIVSAGRRSTAARKRRAAQRLSRRLTSASKSAARMPRRPRLSSSVRPLPSP
jgi:hypothetical protein